MRRTIFTLLLTTIVLGLTASTAFAQNFAIVNKTPEDDLQCLMLCGGTGPGNFDTFNFTNAKVREILTQQGDGTLIITCKVDVPVSCVGGEFPTSAFQVTDADVPASSCTIGGQPADRFTAVLSPTGQSTLQCVKNQ